MANLILNVIIAIVLIIFIYVVSLKQDIKDKEKIIQNQKVMQQKQQQENKNKVFEEKWKTKKNGFKKENNERDSNISINDGLGNHSIDF